MTTSDQNQIVMYSTKWCPDSVRAKVILDRYKIDYLNIDVDKDKEASQVVIEHNNGKRIVPTIFFPDGSTLVEPSNADLVAKLKDLGLIVEK